MKQIYAVLDTNVLVSALLSGKPDTATVQVLEALLDKKFVPLLSEKILDEYFHRSAAPQILFSKRHGPKTSRLYKGNRRNDHPGSLSQNSSRSNRSSLL